MEGGGGEGVENGKNKMKYSPEPKKSNTVGIPGENEIPTQIATMFVKNPISFI